MITRSENRLHRAEVMVGRIYHPDARVVLFARIRAPVWGAVLGKQMQNTTVRPIFLPIGKFEAAHHYEWKAKHGMSTTLNHGRSI
jgi:hypothetical protein